MSTKPQPHKEEKDGSIACDPQTKAAAVKSTTDWRKTECRKCLKSPASKRRRGTSTLVGKDAAKSKSKSKAKTTAASKSEPKGKAKPKSDAKAKKAKAKKDKAKAKKDADSGEADSPVTFR